VGVLPGLRAFWLISCSGFGATAHHVFMASQAYAEREVGLGLMLLANCQREGKLDKGCYREDKSLRESPLMRTSETWLRTVLGF
jgi:hypothetical protein